MGNSSDMVISPDVNIYTCTIGQKATQSMYYLTDNQNVIELFENLGNPTKLLESIKYQNFIKSNALQNKSSSFANMKKFHVLAEQLKGKSSTKTFKATHNPLGSIAFQNMVMGKSSGFSGFGNLALKNRRSMMHIADIR